MGMVWIRVKWCRLQSLDIKHLIRGASIESVAFDSPDYNALQYLPGDTWSGPDVLNRFSWVLHRLFLSRGSDVSLKNREGETPLECCSHNSKVWSTLQTSRRLKESRGRATPAEKLLSRYHTNSPGGRGGGWESWHSYLSRLANLSPSLPSFFYRCLLPLPIVLAYPPFMMGFLVIF